MGSQRESSIRGCLSLWRHWCSKLFLSNGHLPASAEFVNRLSLSLPGFSRRYFSKHQICIHQPRDGNSAPALAACVGCTRGGITEMGESIRVAGMCLSHFFVYFMYRSFCMVAHATLQVSASVICHCRRLVCTYLFFLKKKKFVSFKSVSTSLRSECLLYILVSILPQLWNGNP